MKNNISLQPFNTFGIESFANKFIAIQNREEAISFFKNRTTEDEEILILGGGSNVLLTQDFDGCIVKNEISGIEKINETDTTVELKVGAGENWHKFVEYALKENFYGIENLSLIPGNVGASPMQNIGAYGVEVKDLITKVEAVATSDGKIAEFDNEECEFGYRTSIFKTKLKNEYFITAVTFALSKVENLNIEYGAISKQLEINGITEEQLSAIAVSNAVIQIRQSKLPDPNEIGNAGSFFKNPIVTAEQFEKLKKKFKDMPAYQLPDGGYKLAAGWLIERTGWKGYRENQYGVHERQALVLVNYGGATGLEIYDLSERILRSVRKKFNVTLEREVNII